MKIYEILRLEAQRERYKQEPQVKYRPTHAAEFNQLMKAWQNRHV